MGRVTATTNTQSPPQITHFSHPHPLHQTYPNQTYTPSLCSGCNLQTSGRITYACQPCNFTLHQSCANLPKNITHPSHPTCTLTLLTHPIYTEGVFSCDACSRQGKAWSYHCTRGCDFDLHVTCASKPLKIKHHGHVTCQLDLTFKNPYPNTNGFSCDICRTIGEKQWLYRCHTCGFDVHLDCTTAATAATHQPALQHHHSLPASMNTVHQNRPHQALQHHQSLPGQYPGQVTGYGPGNKNVRPVQNVNQPMGGGGFGTNLMAAGVQGFVEGGFQAVGQAVVQDVISSGDFGGGGGGGVDFGAGGGVDIGGGGGGDYGGGGGETTH